MNSSLMAVEEGVLITLQLLIEHDGWFARPRLKMRKIDRLCQRCGASFDHRLRLPVGRETTTITLSIKLCDPCFASKQLWSDTTALSELRLKQLLLLVKLCEF